MIAVTIATHKRPDKCLYTLRQLPAGCDVSVFHDRCDSDYSIVEQHCKEHGYFYHKTSKHHGKWGFWQLHNMMYEHLDGREFDHYIQLPDDSLLVDNIAQRAIALLQDDLSCAGMFTTKQALRNLRHKPTLRLPNGIQLVASDWLDCCFITTKRVMTGFRIRQNWRSVKRNEMRSSGVGVEQAKEYRKKTGRVATTSYYSLVTDYTEQDCRTVMHTQRYANRFHRGKTFSLSEADKKYITEVYKQYMMEYKTMSIL